MTVTMRAAVWTGSREAQVAGVAILAALKVLVTPLAEGVDA